MFDIVKRKLQDWICLLMIATTLLARLMRSERVQMWSLLQEWRCAGTAVNLEQVTEHVSRELGVAKTESSTGRAAAPAQCLERDQNTVLEWPAHARK